MNLVERAKKLARLSEEYREGEKLSTAIQMNELSLMTVEEFKALHSMPAFRIYIGYLKRELAEKQNKLNELTLLPDKNRTEICFYRAAFEMIKRQLAFFPSNLSKERILRQEQDRLREAVETNI